MTNHSIPSSALLPMDLTPWLPWSVFLIAPVIGWQLLRRSRRAPLRILSSLLFALAVFLLAWMTLVAAACTAHSSSIWSPNGRHAASTAWALQGALGADFARVYIRNSWNPFGSEAYSGEGAYYPDHNFPDSPHLRWLNSQTLEIRHVGGQCKTRVGEVRIVCVQK